MGVVVVLTLVLLYCNVSISDKYEEPTSNEYSFDVLLEGGETNCYYQDISIPSTVVFNFQMQQVTPGGEFETSGYILDVNKDSTIYTSGWGENGQFQQELQPGTYAFCLDNTASYWKKTVFIYFGYYGNAPMNKDDTNKEDLEGMSISEISASINKITKNFGEMAFKQVIYQRHVRKDQYLTSRLNEVVFFNSIVFTVMIVFTGCIQTFCTKRLFYIKRPTTTTTATSQPT